MFADRDHRQMPKRNLLMKIVRILLVIGLVWLAVVLVLGVVVIVYGETDNASPSDTIIVLGSGLRRDNQPGPSLTRRSRHAASLYAQGMAETIICTGGLTAGRNRSEASGCAEVLMANGVPESAILLEERSRSTEENALFSHEIMRANGLTNAIIVSDGYHLLRAQWIFTQEGIPVVTSPAVTPPIMTLFISTAREILALHWQLVKTVLNLPFTYVPVM
ncbi:MAG: YdcF family protein [Pleurocapsa minor GSE-CHR-MK-17-07R]|nr:YdcF family protein [Pleurocapsa minor GSE-CHR-MK 17-07R]